MQGVEAASDCHLAETHEQISQGKALSEREEAVLQALELMTHGNELEKCRRESGD